MALGYIGRKSFKLSTSELFAVQSVYTDAANGEFEVGGPITKYWYRHMASVIKQGIDKTMNDVLSDESMEIREADIPLNRPAGTMFQRTISAAIDHYSEQAPMVSAESHAEDINILRGLSNALASIL